MEILYVKNLASKTICSFERSAVLAAKQIGASLTFACNTSNIHKEKMMQDCKQYGIKLVHIDFDRNPLSLKNIKAYKQLLALMRTTHYDIVHCNTPIGGVVGRLAAHKAKIPYIIYQAHGFHFWKGAPLINWLCYYPVERLLAYYTDLLITINQEDYNTAKNWPAKQIILVNGVGIDTSRFTPSTDKNPALRRKLGIPQNAFVLLSVGELNKNKNHRIVLEALHQQKKSDLYYIICGQGPLESVYKKQIAAYGLEKQVIFTGFVHNAADYYHMADVVINPSLREGLPAVVMEAMACKTPVVASNIRGNIDLLPKSQLLFEPRDYKTLARLIQQAQHRANDETGQNYCHLQKFEFSQIVKELMHIYTQAGKNSSINRGSGK